MLLENPISDRGVETSLLESLLGRRKGSLNFFFCFKSRKEKKESEMVCLKILEGDRMVNRQGLGRREKMDVEVILDWPGIRRIFCPL